MSADGTTAAPLAVHPAPVGPAAPHAYTPELSSPDAAPAEARGAPPDAPAEAPAERPPGAAVLGNLDVPRDTTPTFELEMLVSGAVLFGLLQIPPVLHDLQQRWQPHVGIFGTFALTGVWMIGGAAVYALITCFLVHLVLRAYWVALVGVNSVFPGGVRWEKLREYGPIQMEVYRSQIRPLPEFITRADNAASVVFASGFVLAASTITSVVLMAFAGVVGAAGMALLGRTAGLVAVGGVTGIVIVAISLMAYLDMKRGARLAPDGRGARFVRGMARGMGRLTPRGVRSMTSVLSSNIDKRVVTGATAVGLCVTMGLSFYNVEGGSGIPGAGNYRFFREASHGSLPAGAYANLRGDDEASIRAPWIDRDVVTEPYVRLYVPYRVIVHGEALARTCPGLRPLTDGDGDDAAGRAAEQAVLDCAARVHRVALDGRPIAPRFRFLADPRTGRRVFAAHIPVAALPAGEHVLTVWPARRDGATGPVTPYEIPFWR